MPGRFIAPGERLFGVDSSILIAAAKSLVEYLDGFCHDDFYRCMGAPPREANAVLEHMLQEGFVVAREGNTPFVGTSKLSQLALATVGQGLTREAAQVLLDRIVATAERVNANPNGYPYGVECLAVFGSFLGQKTLLGDLDLAVQFSPHRGKKLEPLDWRGSIDRQVSEMNRTFAALRLRRPRQISIHEMGEVLRLGTPYKVVYGNEPRTAAITRLAKSSDC